MRDRDVREAVLKKLSAEYCGDPDTRIVQEMGVWSGSVRIDIAVINGELRGIELKSDQDTLARLPYQAEIYSHVFDRVELVVGSRHTVQATSIVPAWWGITEALQMDGAIEFVTRRKATPNPTPDPFVIAQLLWKNEAIGLLESFDLATGWRSRRVKLIHQRLASELPARTLSYHVRDILRHRAEWLRQGADN